MRHDNFGISRAQIDSEIADQAPPPFPLSSLQSMTYYSNTALDRRI